MSSDGVGVSIPYPCSHKTDEKWGDLPHVYKIRDEPPIPELALLTPLLCPVEVQGLLC